MSTPLLLDMLGVRWDLGAPVVAVAWDVDDGAIAFALGDGHLAVAKARWSRGPRLEPRSGGGVAVVAAEEPAPQPLRIACHAGSCLSLAADASGGFITGGDDGRVVHVPDIGEPTIVSHKPGAWIDAVACSRTGVRAHSCGKRVYCVAADRGEVIEMPAPVTALAFAADGRWLAMAHSGGVTLWSDADASRRFVWHGYHRAVAWSPDGRYLVTGMQENGLHGWRVADGGDIEMGGYPGQPLSLSFAHDGRYLATSGGARPVCWGFDPPGATDRPVECGIASKTPVSCVSCHPKQSLIAAGYHNGAVLLCQPGRDEGLFIKGSGGGAVNALAWSSDGSRLAFGTQDGVFGWLLLPEALFHSRANAPQPSRETIA
ncbi:WD40 repeat domain-containing protein [Piscinibacter sp.]|uniref:WD40 repeat domain-containing protein n=1 Tax=Piscinibacter sp. TaxID=1903157 RepID=UPI002B765461|nr:WD40 repeat domain-containing protein [Albitalea sp.]HUG22874.1 WD40 repeat domain-containing protein [Albitalea sp.]